MFNGLTLEKVIALLHLSVMWLEHDGEGGWYPGEENVKKHICFESFL